MIDQALIDAVLLCADRMERVSITMTALWGASLLLIAINRRPS